MVKNNPIVDKSKAFAVKIVKQCQEIQDLQREYVLTKQLLRSGTSIGANVKEAVHGVSKPDFYNKLNIALKEACETEYWLELLHECDYLHITAFDSIYADCQELIKLLTSITKTQKSKKDERSE